MARKVPGISTTFSFLSALEDDVERMNKPAMRLYLLRRLRYLDTRIHLLSSQYAQSTANDLENLAWGDMQSVEMWDNLLQLDYLESMREAVIETLDALQ